MNKLHTGLLYAHTAIQNSLSSLIVYCCVIIFMCLIMSVYYYYYFVVVVVPKFCCCLMTLCIRLFTAVPHVGLGHTSFPPCPFTSSHFPLFTFPFLSLAFLIFFFLSIPSLSTRIVPLRFQAVGRRRRNKNWRVWWEAPFWWEAWAPWALP